MLYKIQWVWKTKVLLWGCSEVYLNVVVRRWQEEFRWQPVVLGLWAEILWWGPEINAPEVWCFLSPSAPVVAVFSDSAVVREGSASEHSCGLLVQTLP